MVDCIHLSTRNPQRDILGIDAAGELACRAELLQDASITCGKLSRKKYIQPLSHVISVEKIQKRLKKDPSDQEIQPLLPFVRLARDTGYAYLVLVQ